MKTPGIRRITGLAPTASISVGRRRSELIRTQSVTRSMAGLEYIQNHQLKIKSRGTPLRLRPIVTMNIARLKPRDVISTLGRELYLSARLPQAGTLVDPNRVKATTFYQMARP
jgi:hypothetical protein